MNPVSSRSVLDRLQHVRKVQVIGIHRHGDERIALLDIEIQLHLRLLLGGLRTRPQDADGPINHIDYELREVATVGRIEQHIEGIEAFHHQTPNSWRRAYRDSMETSSFE